uniref:Fatty acid synthase 4 n=1 Tax=Blattella germanica TaxID=6973 RepID=A0A5B7QRT7_BLAGE|nr:fatty acid synthase 4 [Blattella germanica]
MVSIDPTCQPSEDDVVISGFSCRFPKSDNIDELSNNLFNMDDLMQTANTPAWQTTKLTVPNRIGRINEMNKFDGMYFGIHRKQASSLDVMARLILERAYEALVDAGLNPLDVAKSNTLVLSASSVNEAETSWMFTSYHSGFEFLGRSRTMMSNRVSFWLNINSPSYTVISMETAGIEALTTAYNGIKNGLYDTAIVGSISLVMVPELSYHYQGLGLLSPDGRTKSFDASANGYARSDGVAVMILQKAKDAKRIYASIVHSSFEMNVHRKAPLIRPLGDALCEVLEKFYKKCGVDPRDVKFLEADGSGVKEWDEGELNAVDKVFLRNRKTPLLVGSVKSNIGHTNAASTFSSIAKVLIAMQSGQIPPNINYNKPPPNIPALVENRLKIVTEATPWEGGLVAVNTVGMIGVYGHLLLKSYGRKKAKPTHDDTLPRIVLLSGRTQDGLENALGKIEMMPLDLEFIRLVHDVFSKNITNHLYRGYTLLPAGDEAYHEVQNIDLTKRPVWFIFSGMGSQWPGMGTELMKLPVCAATINKCHDILLEKGLDLKHIITTKDRTVFDTILHSFVGIAAIQLALVDLLSTLGIKPDGMIGHSVGELGCAYADGCLTLEETLMCAYYRGLASIQAELIKGYMAAVGLGHRELVKIVPPEIDIACHNSNSSSTISGPEETVKKFVEKLKSEGVFARVVNVSNIAYHSRYIKPAGPLLLESLQKLIVNPIKRSSKWICTSMPESKWNTPLAEFCSAEYLTNNLLSSVLFEESSTHIPKNAVAIEVAPHGLLQAILRRSLSSECSNIALTQRDHPQGLHFLMAAIGKIYMSGPVPQVANIYPPVEFPVSQGTPSLCSIITWDHTDSWMTHEDIRSVNVTSGETEFDVDLNTDEGKVFADHIIDGRVFYPSFAYLDYVWKMFARMNETDYKSIPVMFEDVVFHRREEIPEKGSVNLYLMIQGGSGKFEICENNILVLSGRIEELYPSRIKFVKMATDLIDRDTFTLKAEDVYKEFELRGYQYKGDFKSIIHTKISNEGVLASVKWKDNIVLLGEALLQLAILKIGEKDQNLLLPSKITKIVVNPLEWAAFGKEVEAVFRDSISTVQCGGLEIQGIKTEPLQLFKTNKPKGRLETTKIWKYIHLQVKSTEQFMDLCLQLALENCHRPKGAPSMTVLELAVVQNSRNLLDSFRNVVPKYSQVNLKTIFIGNETNTLLDERLSCGLVMVTRREAFKEAKGLIGNGFLLVASTDQEIWFTDSNLVTVAEHQADGCKYVLLRNAYQVNSQTSQVLHISGNIFSWMDKLHKMGPCERLYLVADVSSDCVGQLAQFVKILTEDPDMAHVRCVFLCDKNAPAFSLNRNLYQQQLFCDLVTNIYYEGEWGSIYTFTLSQEKDNNSELLDSQILSLHSIEDVKIQYLGLNSVDMNFNEDINEEDKKIGLLEFAGISGNGKRVMGVAHTSENQSYSKAKHLTWQVPESWTLEEAATVPLFASLAYYSLFMQAKLKPGLCVLIHPGWTSFAQAAIALALECNCSVYAAVTNDDQRMFLKKQFPQARNLNIPNLETCYKELFSKTHFKGIDIIVNTMSGRKVTEDMSFLAYMGRYVQLARKDLRKNKSFGSNRFLDCLEFYGVQAENLFNLPEHLGEQLHAAVQEKIQNGVIKPLTYHVYKKQQSQDALRSLFNIPHTDRVLLDISAEKIPISQIKRFRCDPQGAYLVSGGNAEHCVYIADWLVSHGARKIVITLLNKVVSEKIKRRISLLKTYHNVQLVLITNPVVTSVGSATSLLQSVTSSLGSNISAIFILPTDVSEQENGITSSTVAYLDAASRNISSLRHFVCFLSEGSWASCEARRRAGFPVIAVHLLQNKSKIFHLKTALKALDSILVTDHQETIIRISEETNSDNQNMDLCQSEVLEEFLPSSQEELRAIGEEVLSCKSCYWEELLTKSPGNEFVKEISPVFIIPGLQGSAAEVLHPILRHLINPAFFAKLPNRIPSIQEVAEILTQKLQEIQKRGPYNLIGVSWGGALTLEVAQRLETQGHTAHIILLDAALEISLDIIGLLGQGKNMETNLLCRLLQITDSKVQAEIMSLPDWSSRLNRALSEVHQENEMDIRAGLTAIENRIAALLQYKQSNILLSSKVMFVRPVSESTDRSRLNQFFRQSLIISMVEGNHRTILNNIKVANIINDFVV